MNLLARLLGRAPRLSPEQQGRLEAWRALGGPDLADHSLGGRYVIVDVESSGLDVRRDRLLAIGAIAVVDSRMAYADSFYEVLRQDQVSSDDNILVHGIGGTEQSAGRDPVDVLLGFLEFAGKAPLVGYHSTFDEAMIGRAARSFLGERLGRTWIDLAWLAPAVEHDRTKMPGSLDAWLKAFGIANVNRHHALADALATGQLFQVLLQRAHARGMRTTADVVEAAASQRLLSLQRR